ncbi:CHAT domain-containing protein [Pelatocladus sp. BLCC-F211]|uniref:CHAT domain-containing protein n=1 Tax=Pelatocladus sp. BLCC-F211 TaxID=3342752 RepID=UPI0035B8E91E
MLLIISFYGKVLSANPDQSAIRLTQKGHEQLQQGQAQAALQSWSAAYQIYRQSGNSEGMNGSLINQSLALQTLGLYPRACQTLTQALKLTEQICTSPAQQTATVEQEKQLRNALQKQPMLKVQVLGLQNLGNVLRLIGKPDTSEIILEKAIDFAKSLNLKSNFNNQILLYLANTERTLYHEAKNKYLSTDDEIGKQKALYSAQSKFQKALELYQQVGTQLPAQLNQLNLLLEMHSSPEDLNFEIKGLNIQDSLKTLVTQLLATQFRQLPAIESIYAQLNFAISLKEINSEQKLSQIVNKENLLEVALSTALDAWQVAQKINNQRAESFALGILAGIYSDLDQISKAENYFQKALGIAKSVQAADIAYQWQQQLGRLYKQTGNSTAATQLYAEAIVSLDQVQNSILSVNPEFQFSFKSKIEPIYQEYLELLISKNKPDFKLAIQTKEKLQLAELKNFLQCSQLPMIPKQNIQPSTNSPTTIYLFNFGKRVDVIVKSKGSIHQHIIDLELFTDAFNSLLINLQSDRFVDVDTQTLVNLSKSLYQLLITPIKNYLPTSGTLVFVPDTYFQNFPFALLHDGKKYLVESYSISIALSSDFSQPVALSPEYLKLLAAGISQINPNLKDPLIPKNLTPLPEVETELTKIKQNATSTLELLNAEFTSERLKKQVQKTNFPILHISTHGQFSSDPEQTFILAWDKPINVREFDFLLRNNQKAIELLVLSACQTAKGDKRSALGIAGVAVQAGALSTLASLWLVDADSTAQLMGEFYKGLNNRLSTAEALRQAQLTLLKHPKYNHPYYWSPFILITR